MNDIEYNNIEFNYNYIICGSKGYYLYGYHDVIINPQVRYFTSYLDVDNMINRLFFKINFSDKINKFVKNPLGLFVFPKLYPHQFSNKKPICFIFFRNHEKVYASGYLNYLRKRYPTCKIILYLQDLVKLKTNYTLDQIKNYFDIIISYDKGDALNYDLLFHPTPMSFIDVDIDNSLPDSDIYFCGYAKNRYKKIMDIYKQCIEQGLKCDFNVMGLPKEEKRIKGINYPENSFSYTENIQHIIKSKCILEIMQNNADGFTPRLWESIIYDRHLLSNNKNIVQSNYYNSDGCHIINDINTINLKEWINKPIQYSDTLKNSLSPIHLLQFIDKKLNNL